MTEMVGIKKFILERLEIKISTYFSNKIESSFYFNNIIRARNKHKYAYFDRSTTKCGVLLQPLFF